MNTAIDTVLFDLDGTLINTNELIISSFLHTLNHFYPGRYQREDVYPFIGPSLTSTFSGIDPLRVEEMTARYLEHNLEHHDRMVAEFPGVYRTLAALQASGFKLGVVTSKRRQVAMQGLKQCRLDSFFGCVVTMEDVAKEKPDPEPVLLALERLQSQPERALMVGDNYHDVLGGQHAGTRTAGVGWTIRGESYIASFHPDYILGQMADLLTILGVEAQDEKHSPLSR